MKKSDNKVVNLFEESNKGIQKTVITETMKMKRGGSLSNPVLAYETWGTLSKSQDNVIVILTGLSASSHVASNSTDSSPGWWEGIVGPNKAIDTNKFYVICINSLGSCFGSIWGALPSETCGSIDGTLWSAWPHPSKLCR